MGFLDFLKWNGEIRVGGAPPQFEGFATSFIGAGMVRLDVDPSSGISASAVVYRCLMTIASSLAALDLAVLDGAGKQSEDHSIAHLFNRHLGVVEGKQPPMSTRVFREIYWLQKETKGQTFNYIQRDGTESGEPTAIRNIPWRVQPLVNEDQDELVGFWVYGPRGRYNLLPWEVLWDRYPHPDEPWGCIAPLHAASFAQEIDTYLRTWQKSEIKNGARPSGVVYLGDLSQDQRDEVRAQFDARHTGPQNAGKHLFLNGPVKPDYTRIGLTPTEMDFLGSRGFSFDEIKLGLGVPVGMWKSDQTYENQRSNENQLWTLTLQPKADTSASEIDRQLLPDEGETAIWDTSEVSALKENEDAVAKRLHFTMIVDLQTIDDGRAVLGLDPLPNGAGALTLSAYRAKFGLPPLGGGSSGGGSDSSARLDQPDRLAQMGERALERLGDKQLRVVQRNIDRRTRKGQSVTATDVFDLDYWDGVADDTLGEWLTQSAAAGLPTLNVRSLNRTTGQRLAAALSRKADIAPVFKGLEVRAGSSSAKARQVRAKRLVPVIDRGAATLREAFRKQQSLVVSAIGGTVRVDQPLPPDIEELLAAFAATTDLRLLALRIQEEAMQEAVDASAQDFGLAVSWDAVNPALNGVRDRLATRVKGLDDTTRAALREALTEGLTAGETHVQMADRVTAVFNEAIDVRAQMIARTESMTAYGLASVTSYRSAGLEEALMYDGTESDTECAEVDGQTVTLDEAEALMSDLPHPNCVRGMAPIVDLAAAA